jgi:hypothetical protein
VAESASSLQAKCRRAAATSDRSMSVPASPDREAR